MRFRESISEDVFPVQPVGNAFSEASRPCRSHPDNVRIFNTIWILLN